MGSRALRARGRVVCAAPGGDRGRTGGQADERPVGIRRGVPFHRVTTGLESRVHGEINPPHEGAGVHDEAWLGAVLRGGSRPPAPLLDDLGSATFRADLASMRHETQYTRLFRS